MAKNNLRVFVTYLLIILLTLALMFFLNKLFVNTMIRLNNFPIKAFFILIYILAFYFLGKAVSIKEPGRNDFFSYIFVYIIGLVILLLASLSGSPDMTETMNIEILPAQVFLSPYNFLLGIIGKKINLFNYTVLSIIISFLIGLSTKRKRVVNKYKR